MQWFLGRWQNSHVHSNPFRSWSDQELNNIMCIYSEGYYFQRLKTLRLLSRYFDIDYWIVNSVNDYVFSVWIINTGMKVRRHDLVAADEVLLGRAGCCWWSPPAALGHLLTRRTYEQPEFAFGKSIMWVDRYGSRVRDGRMGGWMDAARRVSGRKAVKVLWPWSDPWLYNHELFNTWVEILFHRNKNKLGNRFIYTYSINVQWRFTRHIVSGDKAAGS